MERAQVHAIARSLRVPALPAPGTRAFFQSGMFELFAAVRFDRHAPMMASFLTKSKVSLDPTTFYAPFIVHGFYRLRFSVRSKAALSRRHAF